MENFRYSLIIEQLKSNRMVIESWESIQGTQNVPLFARLFRALVNSVHQNVHHGAHGCLRIMGLSYGLWSPRSEV